MSYYTNPEYREKAKKLRDAVARRILERAGAVDHQIDGIHVPLMVDIDKSCRLYARVGYSGPAYRASAKRPAEDGGLDVEALVLACRHYTAAVKQNQVDAERDRAAELENEKICMSLLGELGLKPTSLVLRGDAHGLLFMGKLRVNEQQARRLLALLGELGLVEKKREPERACGFDTGHGPCCRPFQHDGDHKALFQVAP